MCIRKNGSIGPCAGVPINPQPIAGTVVRFLARHHSAAGRRPAIDSIPHLIQVYTLTTIKGVQSPRQFQMEPLKLSGPRLVVLFQETESFPDDLAGGGVAARLDLVVDELLQLGRQ